ncbi:MAG: class I SAM-dependent methyltransferase [Anaerolineales bacterium]|uniref:class I SAM-dependent methyltransferase n=1 Tax=Candidatus Villigracilis proximus TaxID=3140683 RepID=UPI003134CC77|nr:class I SAM-dependent methyltransferase [Anaerolineales bacterium]
MTNTPPVCNYEGSDYQQSFWEQGGREYEDRAEAIALKKLLPASGKLMLELGAGAGRNTPRYAGFEHIVVLDYSTTQLAQAQEKLGRSDPLGVMPKYIYVAADIYRLPFRDRQFDAATMIRALHHMADAPKALSQIRGVLRSNAIFILEYANKLNLKSILRYWLGKQDWNPFTLEPVEFVKLNFDFHPRAIRNWLGKLGFSIEKTRTVSHFRLGLLKRIIPAKWLAALDGLFQPTGTLWQFTPSVFVKARVDEKDSETMSSFPVRVIELFKCPACGNEKMEEKKDHVYCPNCQAKWAVREGIYDFREKV